MSQKYRARDTYTFGTSFSLLVKNNEKKANKRQSTSVLLYLRKHILDVNRVIKVSL